MTSSLPLRAFVRLVISILGLCVRFQMNDIEICNGRIDFKFVLKQSSYIIVYGKNTFGAIADQQKCENNFPEFFCNVCRIALLTYMEMEILERPRPCLVLRVFAPKLTCKACVDQEIVFVPHKHIFAVSFSCNGISTPSLAEYLSKC